MRSLRVLLLSPPLCEPRVPNLAIELLASVARQRGHHAETLHAALLQPESFFGDFIHSISAPGCFAPSYYELAVADLVDELVEAAYADFAVRERLSPDRRESMAEDFFARVLDAEQCLRAVLAAVPRQAYDVIGFSIGFDAQKLPGAAIAKALRRRGERGLFVIGGTGTDDTMGAAMLEQFPEFDVAIKGEAEEGWGRLLDQLAADAALDTVPGCTYRQGGELVQVPEQAPSQAFLSLPAPRYESFIAQRFRSPYRHKELVVLLETSRGCWWGRKHHCTFCGIRSVTQEYRVRPAGPAVDLLTELYDRYQPDLLFRTDPIAPMTYFDSVLPALAQANQDRQWRIFYETKSNLKRRHVAQLAAAGVGYIQPGIESFVTGTLQLMDKGASGIQQVALVKWAHAYGIEMTYGIITGMPGESPADLRAMVALSGSLHHLPPPVDVNRLILHRFSPHFKDPDRFGIAGVTPFHTQRVLYRCPDERLHRLCYQLDFSVPSRDDLAYEQARDELAGAVTGWRRAHEAGASLWMDHRADRALIGRSRSATELAVDVVDDPHELLLLEECGDVRPLSRIATTAGVPVDALRSAAGRLADRGLLLREGGAALSLPLPLSVDAHRDAAAAHPAVSVAAD